MTTTVEGGEGSVSRPGRSLPPGKDTAPIIQKAGWAPGPVWKGAENLASTGIRSPDRPARSQSLYRLRYPNHKLIIGENIFAVFKFFTNSNFLFLRKCHFEIEV